MAGTPAQRTTGEQAQGHKASSWVVVALIVIASVVLGFAFVLQSIPLAIVGGVVGVAGVVLGAVTRIMEDVH
jgi:uncharacterized membrane protein YoaK (UPF0700 family)